MQDQIEMFGMMLIKGVIAPALAVFATWAAAQLGAWIKSKTRNDTVAGVLDRLTQLAFNVVQEVQQTVVSSLPDRANKAALLAARDQALSTLRSHLGEKGLRELMIVLGLKDDDAVIKLLLSYIESSVLTLKTANGPMTTTVLKADGSSMLTEKTITVSQTGTPTIVSQGIAP
jgi:hypothetical protein